MKEVANVLRQVRDAGITVYVITHDLELILDCCTDIIHLEDGSIIDQYGMDEDGLRKIREYFIKGYLKNEGRKESVANKCFIGMGQTVSRKIHRQCRPCGFGCCLSDGALFLCGAYRHNDVGRGAGFFPLCDSLHGRTLRLPGESAVFQSVNDRFPYSGLLHAAGYPGRLIGKLARVPMGTILDTPSGQYKTTIVDRVERMESTFAHLIPEMTANILVPVVIVVYLFIMDWRMALLSLVTLVVGLAVMSVGMMSYPKKWEGAVKAGKDMANAIVEYIGGIEVVKAFSQSDGSYKKYSDAVNYNANYYVEWMRENQKTMSAYNAILPQC